MPIVSLILFQNFHLFFINSMLAKLSNPDIELFSFDMNTGCLGFFDPRIAFIAFVPFGIFCSIMGSAGYVICLLFYSPLVVSNAFLIEPFVAQLLGFFLDIDNFPGLLTIFGAGITVLGIYFIDRASTLKEQDD